MIHPLWAIPILMATSVVIVGGVWLLRWWQWREDRRRANEERLYNAAEEALRELTK